MGIVQHLDGMETWRNESESSFSLRRRKENGALESWIVSGRRVFHLTPIERRLNQMETAREADDPFRNGLFTNLMLVEGEADLAEVRDNPNQLSESQMRELYDGPFRAMERRVAELANPVTLRRLHEVGVNMAAKVNKLAVVEARLSAVDPTSSFVQNTTRVGSVPPSVGHPPVQDLAPDQAPAQPVSV